MKKIKLTQGKFAIVDDDDFIKFNKYKYCFDGQYPARWNGKKKIRLHKEIMRPGKGKQVDHINGNKLDNRKFNLRTCNDVENKQNKKKYITNKTGFKGVNPSGRLKNPWTAKITVNRKQIYLGIYKTKEKAFAAYKSAAVKYFGKFANY